MRIMMRDISPFHERRQDDCHAGLPHAAVTATVMSVRLFAAAFAAMIVAGPAIVQPAIAQPATTQDPGPGAAQLLPPASEHGPPPAASPSAPPSTLFPPQPPAATRGGFFDQLGRWVDDSASYLQSRLKAAGSGISALNSKSTDAAKDAASATGDALKGAVSVSKDAASAIVKLPATRVIETHDRCARAPNGGSDCAGAATAACHAKGYASGSPLDVVTGHSCPNTALEGRLPNQGECVPETFVLRAICQ
jgi:hypothetical protein